MRSSIFPLVALSVGAVLASATLVQAQNTSADVRDLVGARAAGGEQALIQRGYVNVGGQTGDDRVWTNWWNERRGVCLTVATLNGRYDSIVSGPAPDCRRGGGPNRPSTLPGPVGGPIDRPSTLPGPVGGPVTNGQTETIQFARGTSSATRRATITGYETRTYLLNLRAGQRLTVGLQTSNRSSYFNVTAPGAQEALFNGSNGGSSYSGRTQASGVYRIEVYLMRNAARRGEDARYTLNVGAR